MDLNLAASRTVDSVMEMTSEAARVLVNLEEVVGMTIVQTTILESKMLQLKKSDHEGIHPKLL